jgi:SAM-dependent methyltransferase
VTPYLEGPLRTAFDAWLDAARARCSPPLTFAEIRKGVQALSSLYVERRGGGALASRAVDGAGKRAAFTTYYAPLHFLTAHYALQELAPATLQGVGTVYDLGCGTGATGVAVAAACRNGAALQRPDASLQLLGVSLQLLDLSGWALGEARHTARAFGLAAMSRRGALPGALPKAGRGDVVVLGWAANELDELAREAVLRGLEAAVARGARLVVLEPLARAAAPWFADWAARLAPLGVTEALVKRAIERPTWIEQLDDASGLDHREVGARLLAGPAAR